MSSFAPDSEASPNWKVSMVELLDPDSEIEVLAEVNCTCGFASYPANEELEPLIVIVS